MLEGLSSKDHTFTPTVPVSLVTATGGFRVNETIIGVQTSLLLDTGAAVTLLQKDAWVRVTTQHPQDLMIWSELLYWLTLMDHNL